MQREIACLSEVRKPALAAHNELIAASDNLAQAVALAIQLSRLPNEVIAEQLNIDPGHFSRILRGSAHFPIRKLPALMELTKSLAPLQWLADRMGYKLVEKAGSEEAQRLRARLAEIEMEQAA